MTDNPITIPLRAVPYFPSLSQRGRNIENNRYMFYQDIQTGIMPYRMKSNFKCVFEGPEDGVLVARSILSLLSRNRPDDNEEETVCNALREICKTLAWDGVANYEIMRENESHKPIRLSMFTNKRLIATPLGYFQIVPKEDYHTLNKKITFIPKASVWRVKIPMDLGGHRGFPKIVSALGRFNYMGPKFWLTALENQEAQFLFSFSEYAETCRAYQSESIRNWRWDFRGLFQNNSTEFYSLLRGVEFRIALAVLREHLIGEINLLFHHLCLDCTLKIDGLFTAAQLKKIRIDFIKNDIPFHEIYERTSIDA